MVSTEGKTSVSWWIVVVCLLPICCSDSASAQAGGDDAVAVEDSPRIFGQVTDPKGEPLPDVDVSAQFPVASSNLWFVRTLKAKTGSDGRFSLPVDFGDLEYQVSFRYRQAGTAKAKVVPNECKGIAVCVARKAAHVLTGSVIDGKSDQAVAGARVRYFGEYHKFTIETETDNEGRFRLTELPASEFQGVIYAQKGDRVSNARMVRYWYRDKTTQMDLTLGHGARLEGIVESAKSGTGLGKCTVTIRPDYASGFALHESTGANGRFVFTQVPPGDYLVTATRADFFDPEPNDRELSLGHGAQRSLNLALTQRATLSGRVVDRAGKAVAGAIVAVDEAHTSRNEHSPEVVRTDTQGRFSIRTGHLRTTGGEDALEAFSSKHGYGRASFENLQEGDEQTDMTIKLAGVMRVRGQVVADSGEPLSDVRVCDTSGFEAYAFTDGDGRFDLRTLPIRWADHTEGRVYFLAPRPEGMNVINQMAKAVQDHEAFQDKTGFFHHKAIKYEIKPDRTLNMVVRLQPTDLIELGGVVHDSSGKTVSKARIAVFAGNAKKDTWLRTLNPDPTGGELFAMDCVLCQTESDANGKWRVVMTRETAEGIQLAHWHRTEDPMRFSIGVEHDRGQATLVQDVIIEPGSSHKHVDIRLGKREENSGERRRPDLVRPTVHSTLPPNYRFANSVAWPDRRLTSTTTLPGSGCLPRSPFLSARKAVHNSPPARWHANATSTVMSSPLMWPAATSEPSCSPSVRSGLLNNPRAAKRAPAAGESAAAL